MDRTESSRLSESVCVDGTILRYLVEGAGIPTLIIGSSIYYPRTLSQNLRQTFRLAFIDVRHFAESESSGNPGTITLDTYIHDLERVREQLGFDRSVIIGHSHHGNLAVEYAKRYPARVSHLVLIGSPPCNLPRTIDGGNVYWAEYASKGRKAALSANWFALNHELRAGMSPEDTFIAEYVADGPKYWYDFSYNASSLWRGAPVNMDIINVFRNFFTDYELSWNFERLKVPVLVVMGRHDYMVPHTLWNEVLPKLPHVTFSLFEKSGHTPQLEEPQLFDQMLFEWVHKTTGTGVSRSGNDVDDRG